jgi:hypothetical protein
MKFLKTYHNYKEILNENKKHALSILKKLHISKNNKEFTKISNELLDKFDNLNLLGLLTKFRFTQDVSMDEVLDLIKWIYDNNGSKLLPKSILEYKTFESLKDDIIDINNQRKIKLVMNELPSEQKTLVSKSSDDQKKEFEGWCIKLHEVKNKSTLYNKISSIKKMDDLIERISDFVKKNLDIKDYSEKKAELEATDKVNIVLEDPDKGILIARILNYEASNKLGSSSWCISTSQGTWINYIYTNMGYQYFIWDYSKSIADSQHHIGVTLGISNRVTHAHDVNDGDLTSNLPEVIKDNIGGILLGMTFDEATQMKGDYREEKRKMNKLKYDNEPNVKVLAAILMEYLKKQSEWINEMDVYDISPDHDHYGLLSFEIDFIDEEKTYCIGTHNEADEAYTQDLKELVNEMGVLGWPKHLWEWHLKEKQIWEYFEDDIRTHAGGMIDEDEYETDEEWQKAVDQWIEDQQDRIIDDPLEYLEEHGYVYEQPVDSYGYNDRTEWKSHVPESTLFDIDDFVESMKDDRGGSLATYDGIEGEILFNDEWYFIYRTN